MCIQKAVSSLILFCLLVLPLQAQPVEDVNTRIRAEGVERSRVMQTLHYLSDVFGPRLTGSPNLAQAGEWALQQLTSWGLEHAHPEAWDWGHPGWVNERFSAHLLAPVKDQLTCEVLAWTPGTDGPVTARAVHLVPPERPTEAVLTAYLDTMRASVRGKMVLVGTLSEVPVMFQRASSRSGGSGSDVAVSATLRSGRAAVQEVEAAGEVLSPQSVDDLINRMLVEEGVPVRIDPARMAHGLIRAFAHRSFDVETTVPTVVMRSEDFGRIERLLAQGLDVELEFDIVNRLYPEGRTAYNYIAEIPGTDRRDEVVMLGGHLDSWHAATGTTDNATGVAVMMEAVRILKAVGAAPRRTIRIALWTGEEQGLLGSQAYVEQHFGMAEDPKPAHARFGGYLNLDMGTGRVRGATLFGPPEAAEMLERALMPFADLGVEGVQTTFSRSVGGSDHTAFNRAGLPGISMRQDPVEYFTHTWHTNVDTFERAREEDLKQAAVVIAATAYYLATQEELLPRFRAEEMPAVPPRR